MACGAAADGSSRKPGRWFFCVYDLRRKRRGSVSQKTPHQYWNVCDWKTTERGQPSEAQLSLPTCTHLKSGKNEPSDYGHHAFEKGETSFRPSVQLRPLTKPLKTL